MYDRVERSPPTGESSQVPDIADMRDLLRYKSHLMERKQSLRTDAVAESAREKRSCRENPPFSKASGCPRFDLELSH